MHTYIYDSFLSEKKYQNTVNQIENSITDLGLGGRTCRMSPLRSLRDIIRQELRRNPTTLVAVGNDNIVSQVISLVGHTNVPLGIIPIGSPNKIASGLGIETENATKILANRRIIKMDIGMVDDRQAFLKSAKILGQNNKMTIDGQFIVKSNGGQVEVINFLLDSEFYCLEKRPHPQNGLLNLLITKESKQLLKKATEQSSFEFKSLTIDTDSATMLLDGFVEVKNPYEVKVLPEALNMIVGRERSF